MVILSNISPVDYPAQLTGIFMIFFKAPTGAFVVMMVYYISINPLFQIFTHSIDAIDVTSDTLSCLSSINAIDVK